jgi:ferritin-like protein
MTAHYHESGLSGETHEIHRALASLIEELEAVDWYQQRIDVTRNSGLEKILKHNRDEEIEHAAMILEWLRRTIPEIDHAFKTYLFTEQPITEIEETSESKTSETSPVTEAQKKGDLEIGRP